MDRLAVLAGKAPGTLTIRCVEYPPVTAAAIEEYPEDLTAAGAAIAVNVGDPPCATAANQTRPGPTA